MPHYLLIGAGFTKNWGGPLASEVTDSLIGYLHSDPQLATALRDGSFESAFQGFSGSGTKASESQRRFRDAIIQVFHQINLALIERRNFEFCNDMRYSVAEFLARFDAIFSLNQDLLLEQYYREQFVKRGKWNAVELVGMTPLPPMQADHYGALNVEWVPSGQFEMRKTAQPLFKLHGSTNWRANTGEKLLILGNGKSGAIAAVELLRRYREYFVSCLSQESAKLMVIGYSFQDQHINEVIEAASVGKHKLGTYIVDTSGREVLKDKDPRMKNALIGKKSGPVVEINLIGVQARPLSTIFNGDQFAFQELMRFFR